MSEPSKSSRGVGYPPPIPAPSHLYSNPRDSNPTLAGLPLKALSGMCVSPAPALSHADFFRVSPTSVLFNLFSGAMPTFIIFARSRRVACSTGTSRDSIRLLSRQLSLPLPHLLNPRTPTCSIRRRRIPPVSLRVTRPRRT